MAEVGNLSLFIGATAVQSRPKSHTFNIAVFPPSQDGGQKPCNGLLTVILHINLFFTFVGQMETIACIFEGEVDFVQKILVLNSVCT